MKRVNIQDFIYFSQSLICSEDSLHQTTETVKRRSGFSPGDDGCSKLEIVEIFLNELICAQSLKLLNTKAPFFLDISLIWKIVTDRA